MGHTYTNLLTHIIFSTKDRLPYLLEDRRYDVFSYIGGIVRETKGAAINVNGVQDHVHVLVRLPSFLPVAKVVENHENKFIAMDSREACVASNVRLAGWIRRVQRQRVTIGWRVDVHHESTGASSAS
jgi:REP element-mobilizing transposase RayT